MSTSRRVAVNTLILYARMGITVLISLYTTRVILNALGAGDFGIYNVVGGAIAMLTFLNTSMAAATQRFMSYAQGEADPDKQKSIFNVSLVLHAAIAVAVVLLLEGAGLVLFHGVFKISPDRLYSARMVYQYAALSTFFTILAVPYEGVITARENMLVFAALGVVEAVLKLAVALFIVHIAGDKLTFYGFWIAGITILLLLLRAAYCHARYAECDFAPRRYFRRPLFREMTSFAGWSLLGSSSGIIANYGQGIVLNSFFGTTVNAAQGVANQVSGQLGVFAGNMLKALNPLIAKSEGSGNREGMLKAATLGSKYSLLLLIPFFVPVLVDMEFIFGVWLKHPPVYAILFCRLLLMRNLLEQVFVTLPAAIGAVGKIRNYQILSSILNFTPLVVSYLAFSNGSPPQAIYYAFFAYSLAMAVLNMLVAFRFCGLSIPVYLRDVLLRGATVLVGTYLGAFAVTCFLQPGWMRLLIICLTALLVFLALTWRFGFSARERARVVNQSMLLISKWKIVIMAVSNVFIHTLNKRKP